MSQSLKDYPTDNGFYQDYGGQFVSELLMPLLEDLNEIFHHEIQTNGFKKELNFYYKHFIGRPSPLYKAERLTDYCKGADIYFKRDELNHTGSHKINNCIGQILLAKKMKKTRIIAETGAGQHGVATATVCARFGLPCTIYMGKKDIQRQQANVFKMNVLGASVVAVDAGSGTLKDAMNEALRDWVSHVDETYYLIGTAAGPHPYPKMVRYFQSVIGEEVKTQCMDMFNGQPNALVACVGGGSNAIGLFYPFLDDTEVDLIGVEAAGLGINTKQHAASLTMGRPGILHGNKTYLIQDNHGQIAPTYSISAGLDYPGIGPEHSFLKDIKRVRYITSTDSEALEAFQVCSKFEGIIPALEPSHALAQVLKLAKNRPKSHNIIMNLCGRGDKDMSTVAKALGIQS